MENQEQTPDLFELQFDENAKSKIITMTKWSLVIVITSLVGYVLAIAKYFKQKSELGNLSQSEGAEISYSFGNTTSSNLFSIIISILVGLLLTYFLYQFSSKTKKGIEAMSQYEINIGFKNFKNYFLVIGILCILGIVFGGFCIVFNPCPL
jgi:uncharacterized membrane protein affecting hemolysin expression